MKLHSARASNVSVHFPFSTTYPVVSTWSEGFPSQSVFWLQTSSELQFCRQGVNSSRANYGATVARNRPHWTLHTWAYLYGHYSEIIDALTCSRKIKPPQQPKETKFILFPSIAVIMQVQQDSKSRTFFIQRWQRAVQVQWLAWATQLLYKILAWCTRQFFFDGSC